MPNPIEFKSALPDILKALPTMPISGTAGDTGIVEEWYAWFFKDEIIPNFLEELFAIQDGHYWIIKLAQEKGCGRLELAKDYLVQVKNHFLSNYGVSDSEQQGLVHDFLNEQFNKIEKILEETFQLIDQQTTTREGLKVFLYIMTHACAGTQGHFSAGSLFEHFPLVFGNQNSNPWLDSLNERLRASPERKVKSLLEELYEGKDEEEQTFETKLISAGIVTKEEINCARKWFEENALKLFNLIHPYAYTVAELMPDSQTFEEYIFGFVHNHILQQYNKSIVLSDGNLGTRVDENFSLLKSYLVKKIISNQQLRKLYAKFKIQQYLEQNPLPKDINSAGFSRYFNNAISQAKVSNLSLLVEKLYFPLMPDLYIRLFEICNSHIKKLKIPMGGIHGETASVEELNEELIDDYNEWIKSVYEILDPFIKEIVEEHVKSLKLSDELQREKYRVEIQGAYFIEFGMLLHLWLLNQNFGDLDEEANANSRNFCSVIGRRIGTFLQDLFFYREKSLWLEILSARNEDIELDAEVKCDGATLGQKKIQSKPYEVYKLLKEKFWERNEIIPVDNLLKFFDKIPPEREIETVKEKFETKNPGSASEDHDADKRKLYLENLYQFFYTETREENVFFIQKEIVNKLCWAYKNESGFSLYNKTEVRLRKLYVREIYKKRFPNLSNEELKNELDNAEKKFVTNYKQIDEQERDAILAELNKFAKFGGLEVVKDPREPDEYVIKYLAGDYPKRKEVLDLTLNIAKLIVGKNGYYSKERLYGENPRYGLSKCEKRALYVEIRNVVYKDNEAQTRIRRHRYPFYAIRKYVAQPLVNMLRNIMNILILPVKSLFHSEETQTFESSTTQAAADTERAQVGNMQTASESRPHGLLNTTEASPNAAESMVSQAVEIDREQPATAVALDELLLNKIPTMLQVNAPSPTSLSATAPSA